MKNNKLQLIIFLIVVAVGLGILFYSQNRPKDIRREVLTIEDGQVVDSKPVDEDKAEEVEEEINKPIEDIQEDGQDDEMEIVTKEIMVTNDVKHSVDLDEILGGGPPKDGIPSIDDPKFISIAKADFINDEEPGIAVSISGIDRFYPFQILVWHEIVNDTFDGQRVLVTYCPLCLSGIVFDPLVSGERVEFGTSGKLWQSNLVMYDRKTDSYWSQVLGDAIVGEMTGTSLKVLR